MLAENQNGNARYRMLPRRWRFNIGGEAEILPARD